MRPQVLIEPHYLGSLEYFSVLCRAEKITLDIHHHFRKQTYRSRCQISTTNSIQTLSIPVSYSNHMPFKEVKIDDSQSWRRDHWGAIYSAYGKTPFFEFFSDYFARLYEKQYPYLLDLSVDFLTQCLALLQIKKEIIFSQQFDSEAPAGILDLRNVVDAKSPWHARSLYRPIAYVQNFGREFVPNLSILDLLFCEGKQATIILDKSAIIGE